MCMSDHAVREAGVSVKSAWGVNPRKQIVYEVGARATSDSQSDTAVARYHGLAGCVFAVLGLMPQA